MSPFDQAQARRKHPRHDLLYTVTLCIPPSFVEFAEQLRYGLRLDLHQGHGGIAQPPTHTIDRPSRRLRHEIRHVHVHATTGVTLVSLMKAVEAGADCVDTAISSLSLGPGHNPTESFAEMLQGTPYHTDLDKDRMCRIKEHFASVKPRYSEFLSDITGVETEFRHHIPGGRISNMESQLKQQGAGDKLKEVLAEVPTVRKVAG